ncbi:hypothetical protein SD77_1755 [Bacillus badius]|uniref:Mobile element protein n=1 Tax=Bacillus badius TaxID=1455 RepID=A0ABR5AQX3_BACBA|nr:hypothetical protein SD78_4235 [Bacillus badius]KIL77150.1 hypothetical protein SD77_1755 [Bacillus badius]
MLTLLLVKEAKIAGMSDEIRWHRNCKLIIKLVCLGFLYARQAVMHCFLNNGMNKL